MVDVDVYYFRPVSLPGKLVVWRTSDPFSHSIIVIGDTYWSSQVLRVTSGQFSTSTYYGRKGIRQRIIVSDEVASKMTAWMNSQIGRLYDLLSLVGWLFWDRDIQWSHHCYCHKFCEKSFAEGGLLQLEKCLITARELFRVLFGLKRQLGGFKH